MDDEYKLVATDADTGEPIEIPMSPQSVERLMLGVRERLA